MARGGKKRLGLLVPPANTTMEDDFARWMPSSVRLHVNRLIAPPGSSGIAYLQSIGDHVEESTQLLAMVPVDVIAFGCTSGSFLHGHGYDREIESRIESASGGVKAIVTARAVVEALKSLGAKRIAACSPYSDEVNRRLQAYYTQAGFQILTFAAVDRKRVTNIDAADPEVAYQLAKSVGHPEAEAIFISCTAFRGAAEVIEQLEHETGKPVVTSNQATFWACLRAMGVDEPIPGGGLLLNSGKLLSGRARSL